MAQPELVIPRSIFDSMISHCRAECPNEACGILAGWDVIVSEIIPMTNTEKSPASYLMEPAEQFTMMKTLREKSLEMTAIYHSHPDSPAYPSGKDLDMAYYEDSVYVIVSLMEREPVVKGFRIKDREAKEIMIEVEEN